MSTLAEAKALVAAMDERGAAWHGHYDALYVEAMDKAADACIALVRNWQGQAEVEALAPNEAFYQSHEPLTPPALAADTVLIRQAVARGWCEPENSHKEMDVDLAHAIAREVIAALSQPAGDKP